MRKNFWRWSEKYFTFSTVAFFSIWQFFFLWKHELWRDEIQAWSIAKSSSTLVDLIQNLEYEGRPPLWHIILWSITKFTDNPESIKLLAACLSITSALIFLKIRSFSKLEKLLVLFGFYFALGYSVVVRDYNLMLLLHVCAMKSFERRNLKTVGILAILLALVNPFGSVLGCFWLFQVAVSLYAVDSRVKRITLKTLPGYLIITFILFIFRMPQDSTFTTDFSKSLTSMIMLSIHSVVTPFLPFHDSFAINFGKIALVVLVLSSLLMSLYGISRIGVAGYFACLLLLAANAVFGYAAYWWHFGAGFLLFLAVIQGKRETGTLPRDTHIGMSRKVSEIGFITLLVIGVVGTSTGIGTDFRSDRAYSNISKAADIIKSECIRCTVITNSAVFGTPLSAFEIRVYVATEKSYLNFVSWKRKDSIEVTWNDLLLLAKSEGTNLIVVTNFGNPPTGKVKLIDMADNSIWGDDYWVYKTLD